MEYVSGGVGFLEGYSEKMFAHSKTTFWRFRPARSRCHLTNSPPAGVAQGSVGSRGVPMTFQDAGGSLGLVTNPSPVQGESWWDASQIWISRFRDSPEQTEQLKTF